MSCAFEPCVLLYGDHAGLAGRCLSSLLAHAPALAAAGCRGVRVGLNAAAPATAAAAEGFAAAFSRAAGVPVRLVAEPGGRNVHKYPLMRRLFALPDAPRPAAWWWFDDDSALAADPAGWVPDTLDAIAGTPVPVVGRLYRLAAGFAWAGPAAWVERQPWYAGLPVGGGYRPWFATGGCWLADAAFLAEWDYPFPGLRHNGGDWALGELCRQRGRLVLPLRPGLVLVNADAAGRESAAPRRGDTTPQPGTTEESFPPPGFLPRWHDFRVRVRVWAAGAERAADGYLQDAPDRLVPPPIEVPA